MLVVDAGEVRELDLGEPRLGAAEPALARALAESLEERGHRGGVAVSQRSDGHPVDEARVHTKMMNAGHGPGLPRDGPSC